MARLWGNNPYCYCFYLFLPHEDLNFVSIWICPNVCFFSLLVTLFLNFPLKLNELLVWSYWVLQFSGDDNFFMVILSSCIAKVAFNSEQACYLGWPSSGTSSYSYAVAWAAVKLSIYFEPSLSVLQPFLCQFDHNLFTGLSRIIYSAVSQILSGTRPPFDFAVMVCDYKNLPIQIQLPFCYHVTVFGS